MIRSIMAALAVMAIPVHAHAMNGLTTNSVPAVGNKVSLGLVVPLGKGGKAHERKPRLELGFDHRAKPQSMQLISSEFKASDERTARIGISLSKQPQLLLNGREMQFADERKNISTIALIGIGLVAAAGVGVLVMWQMAEANSE